MLIDIDNIHETFQLIVKVHQLILELILRFLLLALIFLYFLLLLNFFVFIESFLNFFLLLSADLLSFSLSCCDVGVVFALDVGLNFTDLFCLDLREVDLYLFLLRFEEGSLFNNLPDSY